MTLTSTHITETFDGDGLTGTLPFTFQFYLSNQIVVVQFNELNLVETTLIEGTHYDVVGGLGAAGSITVLFPAVDFTTDHKWIVSRDTTPLTQLVDFVPNTNMPSQQLEEIGDRSRMIQQENDVQRTTDLASTGGNRNYLFNGDMRKNERRVPSYSLDNSYGIDRWRNLIEVGGQTRVGHFDTPVPPGSSHVMRIDNNLALGKGGVLQVIESDDSSQLADGAVSLSFQARLMAAGDTVSLRAAVLYWDGTANATTADPISAWNAAGTNPTLAGDWNYAFEATADLALTDSFARLELSDIDVSADAENVAVFIWANNILPPGEGFFLGEVQLERGSVVSAFERVSQLVEENRCGRYFEYNKHVATGIADAIGQNIGLGHAQTDQVVSIDYEYRYRKPEGIQPVVTVAPGAGTTWLAIGGDIRFFAFATATLASTLISHRNIILTFTFGPTPAFTPNESVTVNGFGAGAFISVESEL